MKYSTAQGIRRRRHRLAVRLMEGRAGELDVAVLGREGLKAIRLAHQTLQAKIVNALESRRMRHPARLAWSLIISVNDLDLNMLSYFDLEAEVKACAEKELRALLAEKGARR